MNPVILLTSIFGLLIGLAVTFFGERLFRISLTATGFVVGAVLGGGVFFTLTDNIVIALILGFVGGIFTWFIVRSAYRIGLFTIGFSLAAIITTYIAIAMDAVTVDVQNLQNIDPNALSTMFPLIFSGLVMSMISGALVVIFDTPILRIFTAIFGAIVFAISGFVLTTGIDTLPQSMASVVSVQLFVWGALWIPLAIVGIVFQFFGVTWLFGLLQIDQASRIEQKRRQAYAEQKRQAYLHSNHPPQQQRPPQQGGYPQQQRPPQSRKSPPNQPPRRKP